MFCVISNVEFDKSYALGDGEDQCDIVFLIEIIHIDLRKSTDSCIGIYVHVHNMIVFDEKISEWLVAVAIAIGESKR